MKRTRKNTTHRSHSLDTRDLARVGGGFGGEDVGDGFRPMRTEYALTGGTWEGSLPSDTDL